MSYEGKLLRVKQLDLAYQRVGFSVAISLLVSALIVATLWPLVAKQSLLAWLFALWSILVVRYIFARRFLKLSQGVDIELGKWTTGYVIGASATGLCWGLTVFVFSGSALDQTTILLVFVIAGVSAFASATMTTVPLASNVFMLSALLPMAMWLLSRGDHLNSIMALITLVYLGLMLLLSRHIHRIVLSSLVSTENEVNSWRETERRTERFFANMPGFAYTLCCLPDGRMSMPFASRGIEDIYGLCAEAVRDDATPLHAMEHPEDRLRIDTTGAQARQTLQPFLLEFRVQRPGHSQRWIESRSLPEQQSDGSILWHGVMLDVTERRQAASHLQETRARLQTVMNTIPDMVWLKDADGAYLSCNHAFERFFGASEAEIVGKTDYDFVAAELADFFRQKDREAMDARRVCINEENVSYADDGSHAVLETRKVPVFEPDGTLVGVLGVARDITERRRMQVELAEREQEFQALVKNAPDPIFRYAPDGRRIYVNAAVERISGIPASVLVGGPSSDGKVIPADNGAAVTTLIKRICETGEPGDIEVENVGADGRLRYFHNHLAPEFGADGKVKSVFSISHDITERKQAEKVLQENLEQITELNRNLEENARVLEDQASELEASQAQIRNALEFSESIINAIPDLLFEVDRDGRYLNIWTQKPELLVTSKPEMLESSIHEDLSPENAVALMKAIREAEERGMSTGVPICIDLPQGPHWF
ncbi:MAG TPA: PAS domain-containing protein, partial [Rhodoferax sp.]